MCDMMALGDGARARAYVAHFLPK